MSSKLFARIAINYQQQGLNAKREKETSASNLQRNKLALMIQRLSISTTMEVKNKLF